MSQSKIKDPQVMITELAEKITAHGMSTPAIFFLDMVKYVSFLGSQLMVFFGPIITVFVQGHQYYQITELLEDRDNVEFLLTEIERLESNQISKQPLEKNE
ncbi:MAG: hypothetical protein HOG97_08915 [Candidatus Marinimicrobia bacterium]|nr:hypothetical protein [Candidatus Neomarinimicrobiota bacterium]